MDIDMGSSTPNPGTTSANPGITSENPGTTSPDPGTVQRDHTEFIVRLPFRIQFKQHQTEKIAELEGLKKPYRFLLHLQQEQRLNLFRS